VAFFALIFVCMEKNKGKVIGIDIIPELVEKSKNNIMADSPSLLSDGIVTLRGNTYQ